MENREEILGLLGGGPRDAGELSQMCGVARSTMFSLLMKMEKEDLIVWDGKEWTIDQPAEPKENGTELSGPDEDLTGGYPQA